MLSVVESGPCARSLQLDFDEEVAHQATRKIYDLARGGDPRELNNLAGDSAERGREAAFAAEVAQRWDFAELRRQVLDS